MKPVVALALLLGLAGCRTLPVDGAPVASPASSQVDPASLRRALGALGSVPCNCGFGQR